MEGRGGWQEAVNRVAESQTRLRHLATTILSTTSKKTTLAEKVITIVKKTEELLYGEWIRSRCLCREQNL